MSGESYEVCKCGKNPATHENDFEFITSEFGIMDKVLIEQIGATCKTCKEKFKYTICNQNMLKDLFY